jgi:hypothetical protein
VAPSTLQGVGVPALLEVWISRKAISRVVSWLFLQRHLAVVGAILSICQKRWDRLAPQLPDSLWLFTERETNTSDISGHPSREFDCLRFIRSVAWYYPPS